MTLLMCKFVDEEMEQDLMQEKVLFKPTNKEEKSEKLNSDVGIDSSSDKVYIDETAPPVEEELPSSENVDLEGDGGDKTKESKQELVKKRKSPEKPIIEEDKISPTKKSKAVLDEQLPLRRPELNDDVDQVKDLDEDVNVKEKVATEIGEKLKDESVNKDDVMNKDDVKVSANAIINNAGKDDTLNIPGSESDNIPNENAISESIESVEENNVESDSKDHAPSTDESEPEHNANETGQKEMDQDGEKNSIDDSDGKQATTKETADTEKSIDTPENHSDSQTSSDPNNMKDELTKDSTQNDQNGDVDLENKMDGAVKAVDKDLDSSPNEQNPDTDQVEDMDESELLADPAILEAIKLSEITASKEIDGAVAEAEEMEEEESEEEEEEPEEPFKKEEYKIYSNMKEFSTLRQPRKAFMKTFRKELASIRFNSTTEPTPQGGSDQKKASEKDETVPSQVNFLLNVGLAPNPPSTTSSKDKEEERLRRLDKISKLSNRAKLLMGRRSLARLEDRFRSNLIRTVQQNTEVSTLCKEMLILDLNPTKYLWGSALLRKRELSRKLKDWFKQAKLAEAEEMKNPSSSTDNPSLPSKLLRFTSCDTTSSAPRLLLSIKIGKAGLDLKWHSTADQADFSLLATRHYELQCSHAPTPWDQPSEWKTIGNIKAMPLPMACTIRKFESGHIYSFKIRAVKSKKDRSEWSEPVSIAL